MSLDASQLEKEAGLLDARANASRNEAAKLKERGAGVASIAQITATTIETLAHVELAKMEPADRSSLVLKFEQFMIAAARKFDQNASQQLGKAEAYIEQAESMRRMAAEAKPKPKTPKKKAISKKKTAKKKATRRRVSKANGASRRATT
jgi:hypothetical protein